jgi:hypothetical protein
MPEKSTLGLEESIARHESKGRCYLRRNDCEPQLACKFLLGRAPSQQCRQHRWLERCAAPGRAGVLLLNQLLSRTSGGASASGVDLVRECSFDQTRVFDQCPSRVRSRPSAPSEAPAAFRPKAEIATAAPYQDQKRSPNLPTAANAPAEMGAFPSMGRGNLVGH